MEANRTVPLLHFGDGGQQNGRQTLSLKCRTEEQVVYFVSAESDGTNDTSIPNEEENIFFWFL